ncbi:MAG: branched-chain amino acid ABC transporter permease [Candidatus Acetothermia bacterium]|jgi:branched-chain amino acid transport system permease protein|nr:branched-chain amino acid ABC transporter permease [Candidatus Acetothermia bacterium]MDH7504795.1 branched-chain amino acid ABC transporter permease [Candidatus Acetothermia bacterium]
MRRFILWSGALCLLALAPLFLRSYTLYILNMAGVYLVATLGLNLLTGYTGQLSIGHAGFLAIGAYAGALLPAKLAVPFWLSIPLAGIISGLAGFILLIPALRLTAIYLAIATLGFGAAVAEILPRWTAVTGGYQGMKVPKAAFLGLTLDSDVKLYYLALIIVILMILLARNIVGSKLGRAFVAIRDQERAAQALGISLTKYKASAFFISAFYTGIAGALYSFVVGYISPGEFDLAKSLLIFMMMALGGMGSIPGSVVGAVFLTFLPHWLSGFRGLQQFIYGAALVLVVIFAPYGIWGFVRRWTMPDKLQRLPRPLRAVVEFVRG